MANRFWVGGTGTWNNSNTTSWSTTTGGGGGASVPGTGDVAIFDGSSGGGTVTVDSPNGAGVVTVQQITCGAFTGTLDFSANNNNVTLSVAFSGTGSGTRTINLGSGTWTFTTTGPANVWDLTTTTGLTLSGASANMVLSGNISGSRSFVGGGQSYGSLTVQSNTLRGIVTVTGANTFGSLSLAAGTTMNFGASTTHTITNGFTLAGTSSLPIALNTLNSGADATLSLGGTCTIDWGVVCRITKSGAGSLTINNGLAIGPTTNVTVNAPTGGGTIYKNKVN